VSGEKRSYVQIGVLWENEYQGQKTLKGKLGDADVYIFENDFRNSDRHPTHRICVATPRRKDEDGEPARGAARDEPRRDSGRGGGQRGARSNGPAPSQQRSGPDDDIPF